MGGKKDSSSVLHAAKQSEVPGFTSPVTTSDGSPWDGIEVEGFEFGEPVSVPALSFFNLYVCSLRRGSGHVWTEHRRNPQVVSAGHLTIIPAGLVHGGGNSEPAAWTMIYLKSSTIAHAADDLVNPDGIEIVPQIGLVDPQSSQIASALESELQSGFKSGRLFGESLATALAAHLLARYGVNPLRIREYRGGMPKYLLRRTVDYMQSNLGADLRLAELAENVQMSLWHFSRMFKQSTGLSPHQYLMRERIEAAKPLLAEPGASLPGIATTLGFSDQSHLITVFRRFTGLTPKQYIKTIG